MPAHSSRLGVEETEANQRHRHCRGFELGQRLRGSRDLRSTKGEPEVDHHPFSRSVAAARALRIFNPPATTESSGIKIIALVLL